MNPLVLLLLGAVGVWWLAGKFSSGLGGSIGGALGSAQPKDKNQPPSP